MAERSAHPCPLTRLSSELRTLDVSGAVRHIVNPVSASSSLQRTRQVDPLWVAKPLPAGMLMQMS